MHARRLIMVGAAATVASLVVASSAQAAYVASATLYGTDYSVLSVLECRAVATSDQSIDFAATSEVEGAGCSSVSVKVFYTNGRGYYGWTNTDSDPRRASVQLTGSNALQKSYNTATR